MIFLAHPASDPLRLPIEAWSLAAVAVMVVIAAAALTAKRDLPAPAGPLFEPRTSLHWAARVLGAGVLLAAIVVARLGSPFELENPASVFLVAFLWPLLTVACFVWPTLWSRVDPFDTLARIFQPRPESDAPPRLVDVRISVLFALAWSWYVSANTQPLRPASFGLFFGAYTIAMLAGCLAWGRVSWLYRAEAIGSFYRVVSAARTARPEDQPRGASLLLGVVVGGLLFGVVRLTPLWGDLNISEQATLWSTLGLVGSCVVTTGLLQLGARVGGEANATVLAAAPFAVAVVLAVGMLRNRLLVAAQLLPRLLLDPLDSGFDPLNQEDASVDPNPLGSTGLVMTQIAVLTLGVVAGAVIARRRAGGRANAGIGMVAGLLFASVLLVAGVAFPG